MPSRRDFLIAALAMSGGRAWAHAGRPSDSAMRTLLRERIDIGRQSTRMIAGLIDLAGCRIVTHASSNTQNKRPIDAMTVFEIGSITKVFTALLLANMIVRGEVVAEDPVAKYLPASASVPSRNGRQITLRDLATYTSGLPRNPGNLAPRDKANPFADYTAEQLYEFLSGYELPFDPGTRYEYANLGFGLLGHTLALRAGRSYEELIVSRICDPLGLDDTRITLSASMRERLTPGHDSQLKPAANWDFAALAGTGALRSTANDLCKFVKAVYLTRSDSSIRLAADMLLSMRKRSDRRGSDAAWGWFVSSQHDDDILWKTGGTGGYASFIGFSLRSQRGSVVLSDTGHSNGIDDIGLHIINSAYPRPRYSHG